MKAKFSFYVAQRAAWPAAPETLAGAGSGCGARGSHGTWLSRLRVTGTWTRRRPYAMSCMPDYNPLFSRVDSLHMRMRSPEGSIRRLLCQQIPVDLGNRLDAGQRHGRAHFLFDQA
jgi:hypothetical protein